MKNKIWIDTELMRNFLHGWHFANERAIQLKLDEAKAIEPEIGPAQSLGSYCADEGWITPG